MGLFTLDVVDRSSRQPYGFFHPTGHSPKKVVVGMDLGLVIFAAVLVGFSLLAATLGADSRDGRDWNRQGGVR
jgi:hypothetical protein